MGSLSSITKGQRVRIVMREDDRTIGGGYADLAVGDTGVVTLDAGDGRVFVKIDNKPMPLAFLGYDWPLLADELEVVE